jgi:hypothetical protein
VSRDRRSSLLMPVAAGPAGDTVDPPSLRSALRVLGIGAGARYRPDQLPFLRDDATLGAESELQAAVAGDAGHVDLALQIRASNYFANVVKHAATHETPQRRVTAVEAFLSGNSEKLWENSWVRLPIARLNELALRVLAEDMRTQRGNPRSPPRADRARFFTRDERTGELLRVPVSYLLKLSLAQALGSEPMLPRAIHRTGQRMMDHYISDNASPEILSFYVVRGATQPDLGAALARENAKRFLFTELLVQYADAAFALRAHGQRPLVYFSPHVPLRQRQINEGVSDAFYRDLFCSPCLSGWEHGEEKHRYMQLCHEVLSRSHLNAVAKLRDAGIITRNLVVLPNTSNSSLSNNGTHVSLGSERLKRALADPASGFDARHEKQLGDLVVKITEHFLPLFVGLYSAAPYRLDFTDFHPERLLGYLPHQLDFTHLRKLWGAWKQKARLKVLGHTVTPLGPEWLDTLIARTLRLQGDWVPDIRLLDYLVALTSTDQSPALDGMMGNHERVKRDLADLGVFDPRMSFYMLYKPREHHRVGFSGFEARYFSQFADGHVDLAPAVELQRLITALAYHYIASGVVTHAHIPDSCFVESERRQFFFASAMGLRAVYVRRDTPNLFLQRILKHCQRARPSARYGGYLKVYLQDYQQALVSLLRVDAAALIASQELEDVIEDLELRVRAPELYSAAARLNKDILAEAGARSPFALRAREYNTAAERHYRGTLKRRFLEQALNDLEHDLRTLETERHQDQGLRRALNAVLGDESALSFLRKCHSAVLAAELPEAELLKLLRLLLVSIHRDAARAGSETENDPDLDSHAASVY